jgi:hypothetical protein
MRGPNVSEIADQRHARSRAVLCRVRAQGNLQIDKASTNADYHFVSSPFFGAKKREHSRRMHMIC